MFKTIVIPVDLGHADRLEKALGVAGDLAAQYDAAVHVVGVAPETPHALGHTPAEYEARLRAFAADLSDRYGRPVTPHPVIATDLRIDLDALLMKASDELGADLVVMASHVPGFAEYIFGSNAGTLASHAKMSVFVVR
ncbi:universal stress protein [Celeribacter ethanolicus]|uniref:Universal stress protein n=1 Tax=Celeribacter ethanolicus TaxID=1758178 RepID=A0A291GFK0_9RHOB|nr:universal stress protein [Celeribacter ethanolicus]ATG48957.1 universal stress protein [Celeribacter ethanolicus]TNE69849.1 MAG: universal stress protein [Paracoccaceae bacterium]